MVSGMLQAGRVLARSSRTAVIPLSAASAAEEQLSLSVFHLHEVIILQRSAPAGEENCAGEGESA